MELNKSTLRYLALGFFVSGVLLSGYGVFSSDTSSLSADEQSYKEKYEELLAEETSSLNDAEQETEEPQESDSISSMETTEEDTAEEDITEEEQEETEAESNETASDTLTTVIVISEGDPSSLATDQLKNQGIIENASEFNDFLNENGYTVRLRPGSYEVSSDMTFQEIAMILMDEN